MGCVHFSLAGNTAKVWGVWRGRAGQCARPSPQTLPLTCLHSSVHVLSAATFLLWRELRLCGQDGKPKAYVAPGSSLEEGDEQ